MGIQVSELSKLRSAWIQCTHVLDEPKKIPVAILHQKPCNGDKSYSKIEVLRQFLIWGTVESLPVLVGEFYGAVGDQIP